MIRILHTIDTTGPGGAETIFINLVKGLDPLQFKSFAAIRGAGWVCETLLQDKIEPIFIPAKGSFNFHYLRALVDIIRKHKIDIIQSHLLGSNLYCSLAGLLCRVPVVSAFHGFVDTAEKERFLALKSRLINLGSRQIVFVSDRLRSHYVNRLGFSLSKSSIIYNGVDTKTFQSQRDDSVRIELGVDAHHLLVGAVGNIRFAKGYDVFLRASRIVHDSYPQCRFVVSGQGAGPLYDSLLKLRKDLGMENVFFFLGFRNDPARVLNNLDVFVLPSISEGFSIATVEAMACEIPVVATCSGGPEEIVQNGLTGRLVETGNPEEIAAAIMEVFHDRSAATSLSEAGKKHVERRFSVRSMVHDYSELYKKLLAKNADS